MPKSALILYDYLMTFHVELELFWTRKFNGPSLLFFVNRYLGIVYYIAMLPLRVTPSIVTVSDDPI